MIPNDYFDEIFVLNLDRRKDKWNSIKQRLQREEIYAVRFPGIDSKNINIEYNNFKLSNKYTNIKTAGAYAILKSYINLLTMILNNNIKRVLIFEDDVLFHHEFNTFFSFSVENLPPDWNIWYLGATQYSKENIIRYNDNFNYAKNLDGCFAMAIQCKFIPTLLDRLKEFQAPIDNCIKNNFQINTYNKILASEPFLCAHDYGQSDNWNINFTEEYVNNNWKSRIVDKNIYR